MRVTKGRGPHCFSQDSEQLASAAFHEVTGSVPKLLVQSSWCHFDVLYVGGDGLSLLILTLASTHDKYSWLLYCV